MDVSLPLDKMSVEEKLRALELLWEDLSRTPSTVPAPALHKVVLEARERRLRDGKEKFISIAEARR